ncbi:MAG TPA: cysteine desulfurase family protein [Xanthobacteraceae bacterium]|nr:cysteine desulfurase family protein [Xanthobacteraceae bacterium]
MAARLYFDWNATAPLRPEARTAMIDALEAVGNPSSVHAEGRSARHLVEDAREKVAALFGAKQANVTFTSGGSEANALALGPMIHTPQTGEPRDRLLVSAIEHPSVLAGGRFPADAIEQIPVDADGRVSLKALEDRLAALAAANGAARPLVSIMVANNETGVLQPISQAAEIVHQFGGVLHADAVQSAGRIPCEIEALGADFLTVSAHKIGGPKGAGALIRREGYFAQPMVRGGGQERSQRAGTENVAAIAGFGAAAQAALRNLRSEHARTLTLRTRFEAGLRAICPQAIIVGAEVERLPNTTLFTVDGIKAETAVIALDLAGFAVSSGAACSSGKVQASHVLAAMGLKPSLVRGAIRISLGFTNTDSEVETFLSAWKKLSESLFEGSRGVAA